MIEKATFAAGCFWGVEETFRKVAGVLWTRAGHIGGATNNPTYHDVCTDRTGHAEAVEIEFDPSIISFDDLLRVFWQTHDPTTPDRQGPDVGSQYRSVIFYHSEEQRKAAESSRNNLQRSPRLANRRIVTEIVPAKEFFPAEEYHQRYLQKRGLASCHI